MWPLKSIMAHGKIKPCSESSNTHLWQFLKQIDGKIFFFIVNLGMWPLKSIVSEKLSHILMVSTHIYGVSKEIDGKTLIFIVNLGIWPLKSIISENWALFWGFQQTLIVFPRR